MTNKTSTKVYAHVHKIIIWPTCMTVQWPVSRPHIGSWWTPGCRAQTAAPLPGDGSTTNTQGVNTATW